MAQSLRRMMQYQNCLHSWKSNNIDTGLVGGRGGGGGGDARVYPVIFWLLILCQRHTCYGGF